MPDYDLGRARGHIEIDADTRGVDDARASMASASRSAGQLDESLRRVGERFGENSEEYRRASSALDDNNNRIISLQREYENLNEKLKATRQTIRDTTAGTEEHNRARQEEAEIVDRLVNVMGRYDSTMQRVRRSIDDVGNSASRAGRGQRDFRNEINETDRTVKILASTLTSVLAPAMKMMAIGGAVGAGGGLLGLLGGGGVQGIMAVIGALQQLLGVIALAPAALGGAVAIFGTLAAALHGVGDALGAMDDPKKFTEAIQKLAPAAAEAVKIIASFSQAFKGAMQQVQQSLFQPLVDQIQPLVMTWLPALMKAGQQIAGVFGEAGRMLSQWLQQPATMAAFQEFITNLVNGLRGLLPAIQPVLDAFRTLVTVGSQFFPQIAEIITHIANVFNNWVQGAAADGSLQAWIQGALDGFVKLGTAIGNLFNAFSNIGQLAGQGGGLIDFLVRISESFLAFTESAEGAQLITDFFNNMQAAATTLGPILGTVGVILLQLVNNLAQLGTAMGPGIASFFQSFGTALDTLGRSLIASGPALGEALASIGDALVQVVAAIGPSLPNLFQSLADVVVDLAPAAVSLAQALATLFTNITPTEIEVIGGIVIAMQGLATIAPVVVGAITAVTAVMGAFAVGAGAAVGIIAGVVIAIGLLVAAGIYLYTHWDEVKDLAGELWELLKSFGSWIASTFSGMWNALADAAVAAWKSVVDAFKGVGQWFQDIWNTITSSLSSWTTEAYNWGVNLVRNIIDGVFSMFQPLTDAASWIASIFSDHNKTGSPAKKGPLNETSPNEMGAKLVRNMADGMTSETSAIEGASANVASAAGSGGGGGGGGTFSSAGGTYRGSGGAVGGSSGFEQWIAGLTQDLSAWSSLFKNSFGLFKSVSDIFVNATKIVASIWNQGDNPLTRPGGIAGPPVDPNIPAQQSVPGVPDPSHPTPVGKAPLPELTLQGNIPAGTDTPVVPQQSVPGVPSAPSPTGTPPGNPPASTTVPPPSTGQPAPSAGQPGVNTVPLVQRPDGTWTSPNPAWAHLIQRESSGINQVQSPSTVDVNTGGNEAEGLFQITPATWKAAGGTEFAPSAISATPQQQALVAARIFGNNPSGSDWGAGLPGRENPQELLAGLAQVPQPGAQPAPTGSQATNPNDQVVALNAKGERMNVDRGFAEKYNLQIVGQGTPAAPRGPGLAAASGQAGYGSPNPRYSLINQDQPIPPSLGGGPGAQAERRGGVAFRPESYGLPKGTNTGGYGNPAANKIFPQWVLDLGAQYGVKPSTYPHHQESDRGGEAGYAPNPNRENRGIDWVGTPQQMENFAQALLQYGTGEGATGGLEQIIYRSQGGREYGLGGAGNDVSGHYYPQTGEGSYEEHATSPTGQGGHVHTRFSQSVPSTLSVTGRMPPSVVGQTPPGPTPPKRGALEVSGQRVLDTETGLTRDPNEVGYSVDGVPAKPGQQAPVVNAPNAVVVLPPTPKPIGVGASAVPSPLAVDSPQQQAIQTFTPGQQQATNAKSPIDQFQGAMSSASSIVGDAFQIFDDVIKNIGAAADIAHTVARGPENTEDIMKVIDNIQTFIATAADVAKLVSDVGGIVGQAGGGDPTGATGMAGSAIQAIAGLVQAGLQATNMAIDLGQEAYHQITKIGAQVAAFTLGNSQTGPLGGNVRMLLNTNTGQLQAYSEDNPDNKANHNLPAWMARAYGGVGTHGGEPNIQQNQLNIYAGPGQTPRGMMDETMWLVGTGNASVASVAGSD
jgi:hypothetical protein